MAAYPGPVISSLRGTVLAIAGQSVVIEVGGIGYAVLVTPQHALALREGAETFVHTVLIVREDELSLCGFATREELEVFDLLRGVSGVGPKSALGVLSAMTPGQIAAAVEADDDAAFRRVSGIGPKTAKLIVVSLAGKLRGLEPGHRASDAIAPASSARADVVLALVGLGWPERLAVEAVDAVAESAGGVESVPALLRLALAHLGPAGAVAR